MNAILCKTIIYDIFILYGAFENKPNHRPFVLRLVPPRRVAGNSKHNNSGDFSGCLLPGVVPIILNKEYLLMVILQNKPNLSYSAEGKKRLFFGWNFYK